MVRGWFELCERVLFGCWLLEDAAEDLDKFGIARKDEVRPISGSRSHVYLSLIHEFVYVVTDC